MKYIVTLLNGQSKKQLTMINNKGKSRVMCFKNKSDVYKCKNYIVNYKRTFGQWPSFDLTQDEYYISEDQNIKTENLNENVFIEEIKNEELKKMNYLLCETFDSNINGNKHVLNFSGEEFEKEENSMFSQISYLNKMYEN